MSCLWLWFIVNLLLSSIAVSQSRYIRLPPVNCTELAPIGTAITQLLHLLPSANWEFNFLTRTSVISYFLLDDLKGTITVKRPLDREDLCRLGICSCSNECLLKLEINALSDTHTHIIHVPILILDENDNFCYFFNDIYSLNLSENVHLNTRVILPIAHDPDQSPNNIQSYAIISNNYTEFRLDNQLTPSLIVIEPLDREFRDKYLLNFCAYEGLASQQRSCCTKIHLTITDVNDNSPRFEHEQQSPLIIQISELTPIHSELIQMKAFDPDEGLNGQVRYTFSKLTQNDLSINQIFHLNPENGSITLQKSLDYEERNNYQLQIQAKDLGPNPIPTYITLIIQVLDENDCIPELFTFTPGDVQLINNSIIYMLENISLSTPILYLTVSDCDTGDNGRVSIELTSSLNQTSIVRLEKLSENTYVIKSNAHLDREEQSFYTFTILTFDHGQSKHVIENQYELHLIDINDCLPIFSNTSNYIFYIDENNQENFLLHTFDVTDADEHDQITLKVHSSEKNLFHLNEQNQLIILKSLDYEKQTFYQFSISAEDSLGHQSYQPVFLYVNDLNDNPVRFTTNFTRFQLEENQNNRTFLGHIHAEDADKTDRIFYSIHPDDIDQLNNSLELQSNGSLYTKHTFDREQINEIQFRILANDSLHIDIMFIEIHILDENDHQPILKTPSPFCYISNSSNQTIEIQFEGYDPDENENGRIIYSLKNPSTNDVILHSNGTLFVQGFEREYHLKLMLTDQSHSNVLSTIYEDFLLLIVSDQSQCGNYSLRSTNELNQQTLIYFLSLLLISLACFTIIILTICCCFYFRQQKQLKIQSLNSKTSNHLTPSFSSSLNDEAEHDTLLISSPSPQFTAMTTISTSTNDSTRLTTFIDRNPTNKSSSLSSSSSSTYIKMSRSFEDEML